MPAPTDLDGGFKKLATGARQLANKNARLRRINAQMLAALQCALPILEDGLPETVDYDRTKEADAKIQNAIAEAARDP